MKTATCLTVLLFAIGTAKLLVSSRCKSHTKRIVGGTYASITSYPYQVSLHYWKSAAYDFLCGGSLISIKHVLTAGHCVKDFEKEKFLIKAGRDGQFNSLPDQISYVNQIHTHEQYSFLYGAPINDIAVMTLSQQLILNPRVQTIPLPVYGTIDTGSLCTITGFGKIRMSDSRPSPYLMKADVPIISNYECILAVKAWIPSVDPPVMDTNICTMAESTRGSCSGDSGGPLAQDGKLIGVVSWGVSPCDIERNPTVYTAVSKYVYWINSKMTAFY